MFAMQGESTHGHANAMNTASQVHWKTQYAGRLVVAYVDGKAIAGISGPWSNEFALTWWELPSALRRLEIHASLDDARQVVESWARRMQNVVGDIHGDQSARSDATAAIH